MKKFLFYLTLLFRNDYWLMNYSYSELWETKLIKLMETYKFTRVTECTAYLGGQCIWIANHPYASFRSYYSGYGRPSRYVIHKAYKKLMNDSIDELNID